MYGNVICDNKNINDEGKSCLGEEFCMGLKQSWY